MSFCIPLFLFNTYNGCLSGKLIFMPKKTCKFLTFFVLLLFILGCNIPISKPAKSTFTGISPILTATAKARAANAPQAVPTPEIKGYQIQSGDTIPALAKRFGKTDEDLSAALEPVLKKDEDTSTLPAGQRIDIPLPENYELQPLLHIIPNSYFVYGPSQSGFDVEKYLSQTNGWLKSYVDYSGPVALTGTRIVNMTAQNYSISPRVLLTILEMHLGALSNPQVPASFSLGNIEKQRKTLVKQLSWAANTLNNGYYGWREGSVVTLKEKSGKIIQINPADNAGSFALSYYFSQYLEGPALSAATSPLGFAENYHKLFGPIDWDSDTRDVLIPPNLTQPDLDLPLQPGLKWAFTGGPHSGWGDGIPYAAIDFAPPSVSAGCDSSPYKVFSASDGVISRFDIGIITVDLDGDGNSSTGWAVNYVHLAPAKNFVAGEPVKKGDLLGYPSCLGGESTGRNVHIARRYNGEWIPVDGVVPMDLGGWKPRSGDKEYKGTLTRGDVTLKSSGVGEWFSQMPLSK
jgi:murein DD-endopeptidase MepM/ murein hydrolase activator NlpD